MGSDPWLILLGIGVGALGTLIGAGGGFVLVPIMLLLNPRMSPESITSISLAVVFFNALSGSIAYGRMSRIDYKSGLLLASVTVPGSILGALTTNYIPRGIFDLVFGVLLLGLAAYLLARRTEEADPADSVHEGHTTRTLVDKSGTVHHYSFDLKIGMILSTLVGYLSSLLGIGGGIIHVPLLVRLLNFPVHIATATSHFVLAIMAFSGTIVHIATGSFGQDIILPTIYLAVGALIGAQLGARVSTQVRGAWIIRGLAIALAFVGVRILLLAL